jgi:hypothetical protein
VQLLYGFENGSLDVLAHEVERCFGVHLQLHDSLWRGGDYYRYDSTSEILILQVNSDGAASNEPAEEAFPGYRFLLYVETTRTQQDISECTKGCTVQAHLLRALST